MRRAARDVEIHRDDGIRAVVNLWMVHVWTAGDRAGPGGNDDLRLRNGIVGLLERELHVLGDGSRDQQPVGMPRRGDVLDAEAPEVEDDRSEDIDVRLAAVAAARAHHPELQGAAEQPPQSLVERARSSRERTPREQFVACPRRESVLLGMDDGSFRTGLDAVGAEETASQIHPQPLPVLRHRPGRTGVDAGAASIEALARIHDREPAKAVGQRPSRVRECHRPVTLL